MKEELTADKLLKFYTNKALDNGGGNFYKVYFRGQALRTEWGRNRWELENFLRRQKVDYDKVEKLT